MLRRNSEKIIFSLLAVILLMLIIPTMIYAVVNEYNGEYTIEDMLSKYSVVVFGDIEETTHMVGPILVEGDIKSALYHSQQTQGVSTFIKGNVGTGNAQSNDIKPTLYVGEKNIVGNDGMINNNWYTNYPVVQTDKYVDFAKLKSKIKTEQTVIAKGKVATPELDSNGNNVIHIKGGEAWIIETLEDIDMIILDDFKLTQKETTLVTIKESGSVHFPTILNGSNNSQFSTNDFEKVGSVYSGTNMVWSLPNATKLTFSGSPFVGHLVAPNADTTCPTMNYAGCFIVNKLHGGVEGHYFPYNGISLTSFVENIDESGSETDKKEDETKPGEDNKEDETKPGEDNKEEETKPGEDDKEDETKPGEDNKGDETKPGEDNKEDETKPGEDNKEDETKPGEDNKGDETKPGEDNKGDETKPEEDKKEDETKTDKDDKDDEEDYKNHDYGILGDSEDDESKSEKDDSKVLSDSEDKSKVKENNVIRNVKTGDNIIIYISILGISIMSIIIIKIRLKIK